MLITLFLRPHTSQNWEVKIMSTGFWPIAVFILLVIALVLSKVFFYVRKSEEQWQKVDKSKLRDWEDDEM
jgi:hypothetical protein